MRPIAPHVLWIGHAGDVREPARVHAAGIEALVDLAIDEPPARVSREVVFCRFPLMDGVGNAPWLLELAVRTVAGLIRTKTPTLVYCSGGMSRSPCIAAGALAVVTGESLSAALALVIRGGPADVSGGLWEAVSRVSERLRHEM